MAITIHWLAANKTAQTPYFVNRSLNPRPTCMITAGIHGTERAGVFAAQQLSAVTLARGTLIVVPLVNVRAFQLRQRGQPDLNRTFPRRLGETARHPLARELFSVAQRFRPHYCIDLHEAMGFSMRNKKALGQTLLCYPNPYTMTMATHAAKQLNRTISKQHRHFTVRKTVLLGAFRTAAARVLGCRAITVETSMNMPLPVRVQYQKQMVKELLRNIGMR